MSAIEHHHPTSIDFEAVQPEAPQPEAPRRQTRQREAVLRVIQNSDGPLLVQQILDKARADLPSLGIATVYRTLKLLCEQHQVQAVTLPVGGTFYERADLGHHEHFHCRACSQVFDLPVCPVHIPRGTKLTGGFIVEDHELTVYGLCVSCQAQSQ